MAEVKMEIAGMYTSQFPKFVDGLGESFTRANRCIINNSSLKKRCRLSKQFNPLSKLPQRAVKLCV